MVGDDDKGLLEDLIGETLDTSEEHSTVTQQVSTGGTPLSDDFGGAGGFGEGEEDFASELLGDPIDPGDEDQLMSELVQKPSRNSKRLIVIGVILFLIGGLGAAVHLGFLPLHLLLPQGKVDVTDYAPKNAPKTSGKMVAKKPPVKSPAKLPGLNKPSTDSMAPKVPMDSPLAKQPNKLLPMKDNKPQTPPKTAVFDSKKPKAPPVKKAPPPPPVTKAKVDPPKIKAPPVKKAPPPPPPAAKTVVKPVSKPAPMTTASLNTAGGDYSIQVGAYLFKSSLKDPMKKLVSMGYQPEINIIKRKVKMNRVLVGNFKSKQVAQAAIKDLSEESIKASLVKNQEGNWSAMTGAYFYKSAASKQKKYLEEFGYEVAIDQAKVLSNLQEVRVGSYPNEDAARGDLSRIKSAGLGGVVVGR